MAGKPAELAIKITGDADDAVSSFDKVTSSARGMGDTVEKASKQADDSASRLDKAADASDNMASRSSQAAGGLGDLGGALAALPGPLGAMGAGMEAAAPAIMGVTGASDLLNLVTTSSIVTTTRARAATIAKTVADRAQTVATKAAAAAQRVLNAVMRANPIGLIITGAILLAGGLLLLYKRSETFRNIVQAVGRVGKAAFMLIVGAVSTVVGWVRDRLGGAVQAAGRIIGNIASGASNAWDRVTSAVGKIVSKVADLVSKVRSTLGSAFTTAKETVTDALDKMLAPINAIIEKVKELIDWIKKIDFPDMPNLNPFNGRMAVRGGGVTGAPTVVETGDTAVQIVMPLLSALDDRAIAQLVQALTDFYRRRGQRVQIVPA